MIDLTDKKILLVRNDNIGDLICTTPAIEALRKRYPSAIIDIVVNSYNVEVIRENPFINHIYCYTKPKHKKELLEKIKAGYGKLKILMQIFIKHYDAVVILRSDYSKSAQLFAIVSNAPHKIGVKNPKGNDIFTQHAHFDLKMHEVTFCFSCLAPFDIEYNGELTRYDPPINTFNDVYCEFNNSLIFHISARMEPNQYSLEQFEQVINAIKKDFPHIVLTAEPKDFLGAQNLAERCNVVFIQTTSLKDYANLLRQGRVLITLEGGSMHLGPALQIPTIAIFGISEIDRWHPWGFKDYVLYSSKQQAESISPTVVVEAIKNLLVKRG